MLSWISSLITFSIIFALWLLVMYRKPDVNWGSSTQEQTYKTALSAALRLQKVGDHIKNYHPQVLVLSGCPHSRPPLLDLGNMITKNHSLLIVGDVVQHKLSHRARTQLVTEAQKWLDARKIKAFYNVVDNVDFESGVRSLIQSSGFGKLSPNIVLMGYKNNWRSKPAETVTYFEALQWVDFLRSFAITWKLFRSAAFDCRMAVAILSFPNGIDFSDYCPQYKSTGISHSTSINFNLGQSADDLSLKPMKIMHVDSNLNLEGLDTSNSNSFTIPQQGEIKLDIVDRNENNFLSPTAPMPNQQKLRQEISFNEVNYATRGGTSVPQDVLDQMNFFHEKQPKGTIDVWWLYDDGGLTMLLPYILSTRSNWSHCKIRVFALTNRKLELEIEERKWVFLVIVLSFSDLIFGDFFSAWRTFCRSYVLIMNRWRCCKA